MILSIISVQKQIPECSVSILHLSENTLLVLASRIAYHIAWYLRRSSSTNGILLKRLEDRFKKKSERISVKSR